jgi:hypothetical protein
VKKVDCQIEDGYLEAGVCQKIEESWKGKNLFFTNFFEDEVWLDLAASESYGQSYQLQSISRILPNKLAIKISRRLPNYRLQLADQQFLLAQSNILKQNQENLDLVTIETTMVDLIDKKYLKDSYHQKFSSLVQAINDNDIHLNKVIWKDKTEIILKIDNLEVILDESEDFSYQMKRLAAILEDHSLQEDLKSKSYLDLRFKLPVLKD